MKRPREEQGTKSDLLGLSGCCVSESTAGHRLVDGGGGGRWCDLARARCSRECRAGGSRRSLQRRLVARVSRRGDIAVRRRRTSILALLGIVDRDRERRGAGCGRCRRTRAHEGLRSVAHGGDGCVGRSRRAGGRGGPSAISIWSMSIGATMLVGIG